MNCVKLNKVILGVLLNKIKILLMQCCVNKCVLVCSLGLLGIAGWMLLIQECSLNL